MKAVSQTEVKRAHGRFHDPFQVARFSSEHRRIITEVEFTYIKGMYRRSILPLVSLRR